MGIISIAERLDGAEGVPVVNNGGSILSPAGLTNTNGGVPLFLDNQYIGAEPHLFALDSLEAEQATSWVGDQGVPNYLENIDGKYWVNDSVFVYMSSTGNNSRYVGAAWVNDSGSINYGIPHEWCNTIDIGEVSGYHPAAGIAGCGDTFIITFRTREFDTQEWINNWVFSGRVDLTDLSIIMEVGGITQHPLRGYMLERADAVDIAGDPLQPSDPWSNKLKSVGMERVFTPGVPDGQLIWYMFLRQASTSNSNDPNPPILIYGAVSVTHGGPDPLTTPLGAVDIMLSAIDENGDIVLGGEIKYYGDDDIWAQQANGSDLLLVTLWDSRWVLPFPRKGHFLNAHHLSLSNWAELESAPGSNYFVGDITYSMGPPFDATGALTFSPTSSEYGFRRTLAFDPFKTGRFIASDLVENVFPVASFDIDALTITNLDSTVFDTLALNPIGINPAPVTYTGQRQLVFSNTEEGVYCLAQTVIASSAWRGALIVDRVGIDGSFTNNDKPQQDMFLLHEESGSTALGVDSDQYTRGPGRIISHRNNTSWPLRVEIFNFSAKASSTTSTFVGVSNAGINQPITLPGNIWVKGVNHPLLVPGKDYYVEATSSTGGVHDTLTSTIYDAAPGSFKVGTAITETTLILIGNNK
jgi:hypothetical protein